MGINPLRAVEAGYIVVVQDCRGRYRSDGEFDPFVQEYPDGADTLAWVRSQPWCNGNVGMYGASYVGGTQLMAAAAAGEQGPNAIVPHITGSDYWEGWTYQGGAFQLGFIQFWSVAHLIPVSILRLPDDAQAEPTDTVARLLEDPWATYRRLPICDLDGLERVAPFYATWTSNEHRDAWRNTAPREHYSSIAAPALHVGGWYDVFVSGTIENFRRLRREAATREAREGQRLLIGPWAHGNLSDVVGTEEFGIFTSQAVMDMTALHLAFFGHHLRGEDPPPDPATRVRLFLMGANEWIEAPDWPVPGVVEERWALHSGGKAATAAGDGFLAHDAPGTDELPDEYTYDPADPVPTIGGATFLPGLAVGLRTGAHDQRSIEERPDVLVYTSDPVSEPLDVIGEVRAELSFATDAPLTDVTAKLVDVHPDGRAIIICDGILDLRYRDGLDVAGGRLPVEEPVRVTVALGPTAIRFRAGHRVRLEVSSSNFPRFARHTNTTVSRMTATAVDFQAARQLVFHDERYPSALVLPVRR
jgi:putative CocE/NonD family hydrolase